MNCLGAIVSINLLACAGSQSRQPQAARRKETLNKAVAAESTCTATEATASVLHHNVMLMMSFCFPFRVCHRGNMFAVDLAHVFMPDAPSSCNPPPQGIPWWLGGPWCGDMTLRNRQAYVFLDKWSWKCDYLQELMMNFTWGKSSA